MNSFVIDSFISQVSDPPSLVRDWRTDTLNFLRHDAPKLLLIVFLAFVVIRILRAITHRVTALEEKRLPSGLRAQQVRTLAGVINSVIGFVVLFVATLEFLSILGLNLGPLLASAGIAGLAIGFGAQTLVKDVINGFFILLEDQFNVGDTVRVAGVKGVVEQMSLRRVILRDDDGTLHMVPNSQITIVSNQTRDWAQLTLRVVVAYSEPSDKINRLLHEVGTEVIQDPEYAPDIVGDLQLPGIDRVGSGEAEYLLMIKTKPGRQAVVTRELRRRIKDCFQKNNIQAGAPGRVYVADSTPAPV